jgi:hypothetical protein
MHLPTITITAIGLGLQAASAMADSVSILSLEFPRDGGPLAYANGIWHTNAGNYAFNAFSAGAGCREEPGVPNMRNLCVDWNKKRAEFWAFGSKRCFVQSGEFVHTCYKMSTCQAKFRK